MAQQNFDPKYKVHFFICTNKKEKGESCAPKGSLNIRDALKKLIDEKYPHWRGKIRINAAGCLGPCAQGVTAVCYPQGKWFTDLKETDISYLEAELVKLMQE